MLYTYTLKMKTKKLNKTVCGALSVAQQKDRYKKIITGQKQWLQNIYIRGVYKMLRDRS